MAAPFNIVEIHIEDERESTLAGKMKDVPEAAKRIHAAFPTFAETTENPEIAYTDHLPVLARVPLTAGHDGPTLNVLSLNTLGRSLGASGIHKDRGNETDEEIEQRYRRIAHGLDLSIENHGLDCILLQETEVDVMLPILKASLNENWAFQVSDHGLITGYNNAMLTPIKDKASFDRNTRVLSNSFEHQETEKTIHLHNSWGIFSHISRDRENEYRALLAPEVNDNGKVVRIVMGDTNSRIAPLDNMARNIVTGAIPMVFQKEKGYPPELQLGDYPDGGFYTDPQGKIRQMETITLNPETGEILDEEEDRENISWVDEYRMVMCLDYSYAAKKIIEGKTLSEYEDELKERSNDVNIQVSMAANSMNDKGIAIRFSNRSSLYKALKVLPGVQCIIIESDQPVPVIFIPIEHIPTLAAAINALAIELTDYIAYLSAEIDTEINRLQTSPGFGLFNRSPHNKIDSLEKLKEQLAAKPSMTKDDVRNTIRDWENEERTVRHAGVEETKTNGEILGEHRSRLRGIFLNENEPTAASEFLTSLKTGPK